MKHLRKTTRQSKQVMSSLLVCSLFFLIMCPFAHSLTPSSQAPVLIPQKHMVENCGQQKGYIDSASYHTYKNLLDYQLFDKTLTCDFTAPDQEGLSSLALITTSRLIL